MRLSEITGTDWQREWRATHTLQAGMTLYHGTGGADADGDDYFHPEDLHGPTWLSNTPTVAERFARRTYGDDARVIAHKVNRDVVLPLIRSEREFRLFCDTFDIIPSSAEDMREGAEAAGLPGWFVPDNYRPGDDILIVDTDALTPLAEPPAE